MELYAYRCGECGELHHPRHFVCRRCGAIEFSEEVLSGEVEVLTWTKVYNLPEGYSQAYLCFAIVKFVESGIIASVQINDDEPFIGQKAISHVSIVKEAIGRDFYGFVVEPVVV